LEAITAATIIEDYPGLTEKRWLEHDSNLDPVRHYPRYPTLLPSLAQ